jgi:membrane glycosyltransferase
MTASVRPSAKGYTLRRWAFFLLTNLTTLIALGLLVSVFQSNGFSPMELLLLLLYTILIGWICMSFWTALMGFFTILFGRDRWAISRQPAVPPDPRPCRRRAPRS